MKVLHVFKTSDGALWGYNQVKVLKSLGVEAHVVIPSSEGRMVSAWKELGVNLYIEDFGLPLKKPLSFFKKRKFIRHFVLKIKPDIIHCHFFSNILMMRYALTGISIKRIFQVPGPLHMENFFFRNWELSSSNKNDYWIASCHFIKKQYLKSKVPSDRIFMSYYGGNYEEHSDQRTNILRKKLDIAPDDFMVGNINFMYPPKYHVGHFKGLKCHEDIIKAFGKILSSKMIKKFKGVLIGGQFPKTGAYERRLKRKAVETDPANIMMPGSVEYGEAGNMWPDFDLAVHTPLTESCGGVFEPLLSAVPVVSNNVGGIPELVIDGVTGVCVESNDPAAIAKKIVWSKENYEKHKSMARRGQKLVLEMFDVKRTAKEVYQFYHHLIENSDCPKEFSSEEWINKNDTFDDSSAL